MARYVVWGEMKFSLSFFSGSWAKIWSNEESRNTHKSTIAATPHTRAKKRAHESKWQSHNSKHAQISLQLIKSVVVEFRSCSMLFVMVGYYSMASRGSFYSPKGHMSRWFFIWEAISLPCLRVHQTVLCTLDTEQSAICFLLWSSRPLHAFGRLAHRTIRWRTGLSGGSCPPVLSWRGGRWLRDRPLA
jgi:hypothetical protein